MNGIYLKELRLTSSKKEDAIIYFKKGINVVSGPSNTGKTFIFHLIEYMFGKKELKKRIKESEIYEQVYLELEQNNSIFTLESDLENGNYNVYECAISQINSKSKYIKLNRKKYKGKDNNISTYILEKCGLTGKKVRINNKGVTRNLNLGDLRQLYSVNEIDIIKDSSPFLTGQYITKTVEKNVLKFLLTGKDDSDIKEEKAVKVNNNQTGRLELLDELINSEEEKFKEEKPETLEEIKQQKNKVAKHIKEIRNSREKILEELKSFGNKKLELISKKASLEIRLKELEQSLENSNIVKKQYISDSLRLDSTLEAGSSLYHYKINTCPICNSDITNNTMEDIENIFFSVKAEREKIDGLLTELSAAKRLFKDEKQKTEEKLTELVDSIREIDESSIVKIKNKHKELSAKFDKANEALEKINFKQSCYVFMEDLKSKKVVIESSLENITSKKAEYEELNQSCFEVITKKMFYYLKLWGYPGVDSVSFDKKENDFFISDVKRNLAGKGFRSISYTAFVLSLMDVTYKEGRSLGFCVIDSPLSAYKRAESKDESDSIPEDMIEMFLDFLANFTSDYQVIIFENEDIPVSVKQKINEIHFTRNHEIDRFGYIPLSKQI